MRVEAGCHDVPEAIWPMGMMFSLAPTRMPMSSPDITISEPAFIGASCAPSWSVWRGAPGAGGSCVGDNPGGGACVSCSPGFTVGGVAGVVWGACMCGAAVGAGDGPAWTAGGCMSGECICGATGAGEGAAGVATGAADLPGSTLTGECTCGACVPGLLRGCCLFAGLLRFRVGARRFVWRLVLALGLGLLTPGMVCPSCCANTEWSSEQPNVTASAKTRYR